MVPTACPPEGNAHQGEWNSDGSVFVGTDEDFDSYRTSPLTRTTGPGAPEEYSTVAVGGAPVTILPDKELNGPVAFGGYGCPGTSAPIPDADTTIPPGSLGPGEEQIIVLQRGPGAGAEADPNSPEEACFPGEKADNATDQGWDAVILTGRHTTGGAAADDPPNCGFGAFPTDEQIVAVCTTHTAMHELFGRAPDFTVPYPVGDPADLEPDIGEVGEDVAITATFDGWGYTRVFDTSNPAAPSEVSQITIPETADENFAIGFGDLTVHEVEVPRGDPNEGGTAPDDDSLAYFSWYAGGFRVVDITDPANPDRGRPLHRPRRQQLLGRGPGRGPERRPHRPGQRPGLRPVHLPVHGPAVVEGRAAHGEGPATTRPLAAFLPWASRRHMHDWTDVKLADTPKPGPVSLADRWSHRPGARHVPAGSRGLADRYRSPGLLASA